VSEIEVKPGHTAADKATAFADLPYGHREGIAARSKYRIAPVVHIVVPTGDGSYVTWCTSASGMAETPLPNPRRCRVCVALLREYHEEYCDD